MRRSFGLMKEEWIKKYFRAFDRNDSGTIDFQEYVMGFAGMARVRVLTTVPSDCTKRWAAHFVFERFCAAAVSFTKANHVMCCQSICSQVLTDKKAQSLIGLSTGSNIVRSGRDARLFWDEPPTRVAVSDAACHSCQRWAVVGLGVPNTPLMQSWLV